PARSGQGRGRSEPGEPAERGPRGGRGDRDADSQRDPRRTRRAAPRDPPAGDLRRPRALPGPGAGSGDGRRGRRESAPHRADPLREGAPLRGRWIPVAIAPREDGRSEIGFDLRERILRATICSVAERGYAGTEVSEVVQRAGVPPET